MSAEQERRAFVEAFDKDMALLRAAVSTEWYRAEADGSYRLIGSQKGDGEIRWALFEGLE